MTSDDVLRMAKESGLYETPESAMPGANQWIGVDDEIKRFAELIAAAEREACAELCEAHAGMRGTGAWTVLTASAARIRMRSNKE